MELTPEKIKSQEIVALTWMPWWQYMTDDFKQRIEEYEALIHDIDVDDMPKYSQRTILVVMSNALKAFVNKPASLLDELSSIVWK